MGANDAREELRLCYVAWGINTGFLKEVTVNQRPLGYAQDSIKDCSPYVDKVHRGQVTGIS